MGRIDTPSTGPGILFVPKFFSIAPAVSALHTDSSQKGIKKKQILQSGVSHFWSMDIVYSKKPAHFMLLQIASWVPQNQNKNLKK